MADVRRRRGDPRAGGRARARSRSGGRGAGRAWRASGARARRRSADGMPPSWERQARRAAASAASRAATSPSRRSEWPASAFVALSTLKRAPSASGRWPSGVASVLSTATHAPARSAAAATAARSHSVEPGVGGRLDPRGRRARERRDDPLGVGRDEADLDPTRRELLEHRDARLRIAVLAHHEHVARPEPGEQHGVHGGHAGGERHRLAAVQGADGGLERRPCRVRVAPVVERRGVDRAAQVVGPGEDRARPQRLALRAGRDARVHGGGPGPPAAVIVHQ